MIIPEADRLTNVKEYYFSKKMQELRQMKAMGKEVINLGVGNPDLTPSESTVTALVNTANDSGSHGYQGYRGVTKLRNAIANWYNEVYDVDLNPEHEILPLMGSKEGIMHISMAFLNPGDVVLIPDPGYPTYASVSNLMQAKVLIYDLEESLDWNIDLDKLKKKDLSKVRLMWVNYPNMPTGSRGDKTVLQELIQLAIENNFLIINDNPYSLILNNEPNSMLELKGAKRVLLELNSLSKSHNMAGWRIGWVSGDKGYIDTILKVKSNMDSGMFLPIQMAAVEALKNTKEWHRAQNDKYGSRKEAMNEFLDTLGCQYDRNQSGMFIWAKAPKNISNINNSGADSHNKKLDQILMNRPAGGWTSSAKWHAKGFKPHWSVKTWVDQILDQSHVFVTPGFIFGSNGEEYIRVSLCNEVQVIKEATGRIEKIFKQKKVKAI